MIADAGTSACSRTIRQVSLMTNSPIGHIPLEFAILQVLIFKDNVVLGAS